MNVKMTPNLHTFIGDLFGVVKFCSLRGDGRRGWERRAKSENEAYDYSRLIY